MNQIRKPIHSLQDLAKPANSSDLPISPEIQAFLEGILADASMNTLDDAMRQEMINELYVRLDQFLTSRIVEAMPQDQLDAFIELQEKGASQKEIEAFIQKHIPNAQDVFVSAFSEFRKLYLTNVAVARNAPGGPEALLEAKKGDQK